MAEKPYANGRPPSPAELARLRYEAAMECVVKANKPGIDADARRSLDAEADRLFNAAEEARHYKPYS